MRTYELDELLGTKLRALYQRSKGRDLFDLSLALGRGGVSAERIVATFARYMEASGSHITRAMFQKNLAAKSTDAGNANTAIRIRRVFAFVFCDSIEPDQLQAQFKVAGALKQASA